MGPAEAQVQVVPHGREVRVRLSAGKESANENTAIHHINGPPGLCSLPYDGSVLREVVDQNPQGAACRCEAVCR